MRIIAALLITALIAQYGFARTLKKNEAWSGRILLEEDIIVPPEYSLTIFPGTLVFTNGNKILSYGKVDIQGEEENKVRFIPITEVGSSEIEVIKVRPYNINTKALKDEFQIFNLQYAILWSFLFAAVFISLQADR